jgi:hypothetical protein
MSASSNVDPSRSSPKPKRALPILRFLLAESRYSAVASVKNFVKILTGRKRSFDQRRLFFWQMVLHLSGLRPIKKITCRPSSDEGPGSQVFSVMNAINFARCAGLTYVHTPFSQIAHADRSMQDWAAAWDTLFNLGAGELPCDPSAREVVSHCYNPAALELCLGWDLRRAEIQQHFQAMIPDLRRKFYLNKSPRWNQKVTIAVHARRGWDTGSPSGSYRLKSAESILRTITRVKNVLDSRGIQHTISIYSEGGRADFEELDFPGIQISKYRVGRYARGRTDDVSDLSLSSGESVVDVDAIQAMQDMIEADVLIVAISSFSYCAALISDGIKIFASADERPRIDAWLVRSDDGSFDAAAIERQLSQLIQINPAAK